MKLTCEMEKEIKKILIHGMYAFKVGYANSDTIRDREQEAIEYYLARDGKMPDAEQMRFYCLIDRMYAHILETLKESK